MIKESLLENLSIYNDSLSVYYLASVFISILSVVFAWWYHKYTIASNGKDKTKMTTNCQNVVPQPSVNNEVSDFSEGEEQDNDHLDDEIISKLKIGRQTLLAEKVAASLTEEQLLEEREVEKQQLEAIFQLLQSQQDKFQVASIEELENQLKLYRH
ncbi:matrix-remodeling-associated protein 7 [Homalodisca vitripennis]|uniref:matrix-remodeling-associated protein 7 n=1 Tax=Homalodisca vitripennis TaxID=197043 RepID=UPI001EEC5508|nr:matrix-remodeling-associated protein 7 [Homalodisca vitripennis]